MPAHAITFYEYKGKNVSINELAKISGFPYYLIHKRVKILKWPAEKAISQRACWSTRGGTYPGHFKINRRECEQHLDETPFNALPKKFQKLIMTVPGKGKLPYGQVIGKTRVGKQYGRFLRESCRKAFDEYYEKVFYPRKKAIYDHEQHIKQQQEIGDMDPNPEGPGNPEPDLVSHTVRYAGDQHLVVQP